MNQTNRSQPVIIRFTEEERARVIKAAAHEGRSTSDYLRRLVLKALPATSKPRSP